MTVLLWNLKVYHNHRRGEARRKSRRIRSRIRRRLRASGGATGGAQFGATTGSSSRGGNSVLSQPGFYNDYRQETEVLSILVAYILGIIIMAYSYGNILIFSFIFCIIYRLKPMYNTEARVYKWWEKVIVTKDLSRMVQKAMQIPQILRSVMDRKNTSNRIKLLSSVLFSLMINVRFNYFI